MSKHLDPGEADEPLRIDAPIPFLDPLFTVSRGVSFMSTLAIFLFSSS